MLTALPVVGGGLPRPVLEYGQRDLVVVVRGKRLPRAHRPADLEVHGVAWELGSIFWHEFIIIFPGVAARRIFPRRFVEESGRVGAGPGVGEVVRGLLEAGNVLEDPLLQGPAQVQPWRQGRDQQQQQE